MEIHGFNKTTLLDYPGHLAATIFTGRCNFRCPFCHNGPLVLHPKEQQMFSEDEVLATLKKRNNILEGVCITGGEPTLQEDLLDFIHKIKGFGLKVKLDTNGTRPDLLKTAIEEGLIDYVAMDIKNAPDKYGLSAGISNPPIEKLKVSARILLNGTLDYEFRTTVVKEHHTREDFERIAIWLAGAKKYFLQSYRDADGVIEKGLHAPEEEDLKEYQRILQRRMEKVEIRGI